MRIRKVASRLMIGTVIVMMLLLIVSAAVGIGSKDTSSAEAGGPKKPSPTRDDSGLRWTGWGGSYY